MIFLIHVVRNVIPNHKTLRRFFYWLIILYRISPSVDPRIASAEALHSSWGNWEGSPASFKVNVEHRSVVCTRNSASFLIILFFVWFGLKPILWPKSRFLLASASKGQIKYLGFKILFWLSQNRHPPIISHSLCAVHSTKCHALDLS